MAKSIKQKMREAEKKNHEEFRQQLMEDVADLLERWNQQAIKLMKRKTRENNQVIEEMQGTKREVGKVIRQLREINVTTAAEVKKLKQGRTWKFYMNTVVAAILASLFTILLCAAYWPQIQSLVN